MWGGAHVGGDGDPQASQKSKDWACVKQQVLWAANRVQWKFFTSLISDPQNYVSGTGTTEKTFSPSLPMKPLSSRRSQSVNIMTSVYLILCGCMNLPMFAEVKVVIGVFNLFFETSSQNLKLTFC